MKKFDTKKITLIGIFVSFALVLSIFENSIPLPFVVPGAKLGLSNIVTLISIFLLGYREAFLILIIRIILGTAFSGGFSGLMYSFSGGMMSYISMIVFIKIFKEKITPVGISATGSFFHSIGQIIVSVLVLENLRMFTYLPALSIASVISGTFTGMVAMVFIKKYKVHMKYLI
jgi:heptaprenyl diphosphate synthase